MHYAVLFLAFVATVALLVAVGEVVFARRQRIESRLSEIRKMESETEEENVLQLPFMERVLKPLFHSLGSTLGNLAPREIRVRIEKQIVYAGTPWNITFNGFLALQVLMGGVFFLFSLLFFGLVNMDGGKALILTLLMTAVGLYIPYVLINSRAVNRQKEIQKILPDMMDLLLVSVEAGLGFDMGLKRVADQMPGILSAELARALEEIRMGKTREEALRGIVRRTGVADLSSFVSAIIQAEQMGSNIAGTLRVQADSMRQKRRQRVEEIAMKAPVKMLFPLVFFIFPALFVVLLGPAAIRIFQVFRDLF